MYESFTSQEFVDKLVGFFSIEEVKGKDKYDVRKYTMFKVRYNYCNESDVLLPNVCFDV